MHLIDRVNEDLKNAMKARDEAKLRTLRGMKSAFLQNWLSSARIHWSNTNKPAVKTWLKRNARNWK